MRGHCWRGEQCVYLHKDVDKDEDLRKETNEEEATSEDEDKYEGSKKETNEYGATSEKEINRNVEQSPDPLDDSLVVLLRLVEGSSKFRQNQRFSAK